LHFLSYEKIGTNRYMASLSEDVLIGRLLLEQEIGRSCILTNNSQIEEIVDLVMGLLCQGLLARPKVNEAAQHVGRSPHRTTDGRATYCQPRYDGDSSQRKFLVRFADAEISDRTFDDENEARAFFDAAINNWNCYLFGLLER
jgi:hypothetical protein